MCAYVCSIRGSEIAPGQVLSFDWPGVQSEQPAKIHPSQKDHLNAL